MVKKACKHCKRIVTGNLCPSCKSSDLTSSHQGTVIIYNIQSDVAERLGIKEPGKYVLKI